MAGGRVGRYLVRDSPSWVIWHCASASCWEEDLLGGGKRLAQSGLRLVKKQRRAQRHCRGLGQKHAAAPLGGAYCDDNHDKPVACCPISSDAPVSARTGRKSHPTITPCRDMRAPYPFIPEDRSGPKKHFFQSRLPWVHSDSTIPHCEPPPRSSRHALPYLRASSHSYSTRLTIGTSRVTRVPNPLDDTSSPCPLLLHARLITLFSLHHGRQLAAPAVALSQLLISQRGFRHVARFVHPVAMCTSHP